MIPIPIKTPEQAAYYRSLCKKYWIGFGILLAIILIIVGVNSIGLGMVIVFGPMLFIFAIGLIGIFLLFRLLWRLGSK